MSEQIPLSLLSPSSSQPRLRFTQCACATTASPLLLQTLRATSQREVREGQADELTGWLPPEGGQPLLVSAKRSGEGNRAAEPSWRCWCCAAALTVPPLISSLCVSAGTWLKEWRRRYFRLIGSKLYFSKDVHVRGGPAVDGLGKLVLENAGSHLWGGEGKLLAACLCHPLLVPAPPRLASSCLLFAG